MNIKIKEQKSRAERLNDFNRRESLTGLKLGLGALAGSYTGLKIGTAIGGPVGGAIGTIGGAVGGMALVGYKPTRKNSAIAKRPKIDSYETQIKKQQEYDKAEAEARFLKENYKLSESKEQEMFKVVRRTVVSDDEVIENDHSIWESEGQAVKTARLENKKLMEHSLASFKSGRIKYVVVV